MARTLPAWDTPVPGGDSPSALDDGAGGQGAGEVIGEPGGAVGGGAGSGKVMGQPSATRQRGATSAPGAPAVEPSRSEGTSRDGKARKRAGETGDQAGQRAREAGGQAGDAGKPAGDRSAAGAEPDAGAGNRVVGDVGLGDARSVLIAGGPVDSAGAARILNGRVSGAEDADMVFQQAPPVSPKAVERRTGSKKFGPVKVGAGALMARAAWAAGMECGPAAGDASAASAEIGRATVTGGGSGALVRVPERISSRSGTALRQRAGITQTVASATITAGRISLVDNEVRIRVLRAPELRATMTADRQARVDYLPAIVEVSSRGGEQARLTTAGDHIDITLSEEMRPLESLPAPLEPVGRLPLPKIPHLPGIGEPESAPAPAAKAGSTLRVSLGEVRQARKDDAIAARATAIRVTLTRNAGGSSGKSAHALSGVVADLGIGMLEAAAVAPTGGGSAHGASAQVDSAQGNSSAGTGAGITSLPITGPRAITLIIVGAGLVLGGICAVALTSRRRRNEP